MLNMYQTATLLHSTQQYYVRKFALKGYTVESKTKLTHWNESFNKIRKSVYSQKSININLIHWS